MALINPIEKMNSHLQSNADKGFWKNGSQKEVKLEDISSEYAKQIVKFCIGKGFEAPKQILNIMLSNKKIKTVEVTTGELQIDNGINPVLCTPVFLRREIEYRFSKVFSDMSDLTVIVKQNVEIIGHLIKITKGTETKATQMNYHTDIFTKKNVEKYFMPLVNDVVKRFSKAYKRGEKNEIKNEVPMEQDMVCPW